MTQSSSQLEREKLSSNFFQKKMYFYACVCEFANLKSNQSRKTSLNTLYSYLATKRYWLFREKKIHIEKMKPRE